MSRLRARLASLLVRGSTLAVVRRSEVREVQRAAETILTLQLRRRSKTASMAVELLKHSRCLVVGEFR